MMAIFAGGNPWSIKRCRARLVWTIRRSNELMMLIAPMRCRIERGLSLKGAESCTVRIAGSMLRMAGRKNLSIIGKGAHKNG
jgi:hypothetical protein